MNAPDYEARKAAWIARNLESAPPLTEAQKSLIRTAFAGSAPLREGSAA